MELEFKGTKGDWSFEEDFDKHYDQPTIKVNSSYGIEGICTVWSGSDKIQDETICDAKLIAAAPDLLAACIEFIKRVEKGEVRSTKSYNRFKEVVEKALL